MKDLIISVGLFGIAAYLYAISEKTPLQLWPVVLCALAAAVFAALALAKWLDRDPKTNEE
jgi:hypothetical protein